MKYFIIIKDGSERIADKNFVELNHIPLWQNLILELIGEEVYIDTDSNRILDFFKNHQELKSFHCYKRLQKHIDLENDKGFGVSPVLKMVERFLDEYVEDESEIIVTPHVTSPFIKKKTIENASLKLNEGYDSVQACTIHHEFAYFKGKPVNFNPEVVSKTQDLEPIIIGNGAFFIFTKKTFKKYKHRTGINPYFYPIYFPEYIEIDTFDDLLLARAIVKHGNN